MGASDPAGGAGPARPGRETQETAAADLRVTRRAADGRLVVALTGEIDLSNVDDVERWIVEVIASASAVAVDLGAVTYLDSRGLRLLLRLADRHLQGSLDLVIVAGSDTIAYELLQVTGLVGVVPVVPELA